MAVTDLGIPIESPYATSCSD